MLVSVETTPTGMRLSGSGVLKEGHDPVVVLLGAARVPAGLACGVALFHAGLEPGAYDLSDGSRVLVPAALVGGEHRVHTNVTLEVQS